ncbi:MAG: nitrophenyl compound nitroreductase subunit ArsF family protein [Candidatus Spyradenecus sp.]
MNTPPDATPTCPCKCKQRQAAWKRICGVVLVAFAAIALLRAFNAAPSTSAAEPEPSASASAVAQGPELFYFHGSRRCRTCTRMEQMAREVLAERLGADAPSVDVPLQCVNLDLPENQHYVTDFALTMRTFVLVEGTRFAVLDQCWRLAHDEAAFKAYLARSLAAFTTQEAQP